MLKYLIFAYVLLVGSVAQADKVWISCSWLPAPILSPNNNELDNRELIVQYSVLQTTTGELFEGEDVAWSDEGISGWELNSEKFKKNETYIVIVGWVDTLHWCPGDSIHYETSCTEVKGFVGGEWHPHVDISSVDVTEYDYRE